MLFDADFTMTINGQGVGAGTCFEVVNPATEAGIGTENSLDGLLEYTNSQTIMIKRKVAA